MSALQALESAEFVHRTCVTLDRWWEEQDLDLLLTPTVARRTPPMTDYLPPPHGDYAVSPDDPLSIAYALAALMPLICFTALYNWTGQPAVSLPLGIDATAYPSVSSSPPDASARTTSSTGSARRPTRRRFPPAGARPRRDSRCTCPVPTHLRSPTTSRGTGFSCAGCVL